MMFNSDGQKKSRPSESTSGEDHSETTTQHSADDLTETATGTVIKAKNLAYIWFCEEEQEMDRRFGTTIVPPL